MFPEDIELRLKPLVGNILQKNQNPWLAAMPFVLSITHFPVLQCSQALTVERGPRETLNLGGEDKKWQAICVPPCSSVQLT